MAAPLWRDVREKGSVLGMSFTVLIYRFFGRWLAEFILWFVVAYFLLKDGRMRKASANYLARVHNRNEQEKPSLRAKRSNLTAWRMIDCFGRRTSGDLAMTTRRWIEVYRHCLSFAQTSLDRFDVWTNRLDHYTFHYHGAEHLTALLEQGKGAVLIGAHLGNFDTLRALAKQHKAKVHILTDNRNAQKFSGILKRFCPGMNEGVLEYDTHSVNTIFELEQAVGRGEFVALLGDRIVAETARSAGRVSPALFLDEKALFPQAPFLFTAHMKCPVFLMFGLRRAARHYDLYIEPFANPVELPAQSRDEALARYISRYAERLTHYCRLYPLQWFNFYDFWRQPHSKSA